MSLRTISLRLLAAITLTAATLAASPASAQIRITEVMSSSGTGGTADWFEVTNYGTSAVTSTGWRMDDNTFLFANSVELLGVTTIAAGETVVFLESALPGTDVPAFQTFWGGSASTAQIGTYSGSGVGFSSSGDGVVVFSSTGTELTPQTSFPAATATTGSSFYWAYDAAGDFVTGFGTQSAGVVSTVGTLPGTFSDQVTFTSADVLANIGSPGTAVNAVPEPSSIVLAAFAGLGLAGYAARRRRSRKATPAAA